MNTNIILPILIVFYAQSQLAIPIAFAGDAREVYHYDGAYYDILGIDKDEGIASGVAAAKSNMLALISEPDYANSKFIVTKDSQIQDVSHISIMNCYSFPLLPLSMDVGLTDEDLLLIRRCGTKMPVTNIPVLRVCSKNYSAWYNTTIITYAFRNPDVLARYHNPDGWGTSESCFREYPLEELDLYQLWDSSKRPAPGIPEYPW